MARAMSLLLVLLVAVCAPAAAQTRYKTPGNRFWVDLPDGWNVEERQRNSWVIQAGRVSPGMRCTVEYSETPDTLWTSQARLNDVISSDEFQRVPRETMSRGLGVRVDDVATAELLGVRFLRLRAPGRMRVDGGSAEPAIMIAAWALTPGQAWRLSCGVPQLDADRTLPQLEQMLTSFTIINPDGATNAR